MAADARTQSLYPAPLQTGRGGSSGVGGARMQAVVMGGASSPLRYQERRTQTARQSWRQQLWHLRQCSVRVCRWVQERLVPARPLSGCSWILKPSALRAARGARRMTLVVSLAGVGTTGRPCQTACRLLRLRVYLKGAPGGICCSRHLRRNGGAMPSMHAGPTYRVRTAIQQTEELLWPSLLLPHAPKTRLTTCKLQQWSTGVKAILHPTRTLLHPSCLPLPEFQQHWQIEQLQCVQCQQMAAGLPPLLRRPSCQRVPLVLMLCSAFRLLVRDEGKPLLVVRLGLHARLLPLETDRGLISHRAGGLALARG
mmetsp:Transcript_27470/g.65077  ORF Transcript_27470/g.65077 Transcript_27470/m.65077 type:complete len:311 (-) Transcript_27470:2916-3848(-)